MKAGEVCRKVIRAVSGIVDFVVLLIILLLLVFAGYALWDSEQVYKDADKANYAVYKPTAANGGLTFKELQEMNEDVIAWITVYGTGIDYPVTQGKDNMEYVNKNAEGKYSLSGAIFLDRNNSRDFSDFNSVLYGHHMARGVMFGDLGKFSDREFFDSREYGNLYFGEKDHGLEFFAFLHTDAYDSIVFTANVNGDDARQACLDVLLQSAMHSRDVSVTIEDNIVLLTTCSSSSTNGRDVLIAKITDETYEDHFYDAANGGRWFSGVDGRGGFFDDATRMLTMLVLILAALLIMLTLIKRNREKSKEEK